MRPIRASRLLVLGFAAALAACQEGGSNKNAVSEVTLQVDHHMSGFGGQIRFEEGFPLNATTAYADSATLHFKDDGNYFLTRPGAKASPEDRYFLQKDGALTITIAQRNNAALRWPGYYDLDGDGYFFVSRSASFLRLFVGVRKISGTPNLEGLWHVFGDTIVFANPSQKEAHEHVGRAFWGTVTFDAKDKVTGGSWKNSAGGTVLVGGAAKVGSLGATDLSLTLSNGFSSGASYSGGVAKHLGVLMDQVPTAAQTDEKNVGLLVMVRAIPTGADLKELTGVWRIAVHAIFSTPGRSGVDVAEGQLEIRSDKTWSMTLAGATFKGTLGVGTKGDLLFTETTVNQAWRAAVDPDYRTIVIADPVVERTGNPFVGVFIAVRGQTVK